MSATTADKGWCRGNDEARNMAVVSPRGLRVSHRNVPNAILRVDRLWKTFWNLNTALFILILLERRRAFNLRKRAKL